MLIGGSMTRISIPYAPDSSVSIGGERTSLPEATQCSAISILVEHLYQPEKPMLLFMFISLKLLCEGGV
jgi:hypothetical protein